MLGRSSRKTTAISTEDGLHIAREKADDEIVVIDTASTSHTLLLDSTLSYHQEVQRIQGQIPESVKTCYLD